MGRLKLKFRFFAESQEKLCADFCDRYNKQYPWRKKKAFYTPWEDSNSKEKAFLAWFEE